MGAAYLAARWLRLTSRALSVALVRSPLLEGLCAVPDEVDVGDRQVVAAALAARADVIVTKNVRHFAPERLIELGLLVQTADAFLIHLW